MVEEGEHVLRVERHERTCRRIEPTALNFAAVHRIDQPKVVLRWLVVEMLHTRRDGQPRVIQKYQALDLVVERQGVP